MRRLDPVAFYSRKLQSAQMNCAIHDKELLAIMEALRERQRYLSGEEKRVTVYTDQNGIQSFWPERSGISCKFDGRSSYPTTTKKVVYWPGSRGGKSDVLSKPQEYDPEERAHHSEQPILKTEQFQISLIHQRRSAVTALSTENDQSTSLRIMKLSSKGRIQHRDHDSWLDMTSMAWQIDWYRKGTGNGRNRYWDRIAGRNQGKPSCKKWYG